LEIVIVSVSHLSHRHESAILQNLMKHKKKSISKPTTFNNDKIKDPYESLGFGLELHLHSYISAHRCLCKQSRLSRYNVAPNPRLLDAGPLQILHALRMSSFSLAWMVYCLQILRALRTSSFSLAGWSTACGPGDSSRCLRG
jgi:hypothetical protein